MGLIPDFRNIDSIGGLLAALIQLLILAILARAVLSWFVRDPCNPIMQALNTITDPILQPLRQIMPRFGMMDFTPLVAIIVLSIIAGMVRGIGI
ncbi:MAG: YggT family protein [Chloroflexi bacterium]|nr:YggT family protein [Chloroflexota bacterium]MCH8066492.1 YggT family protein [Chloroflexota bacterium]